MTAATPHVLDRALQGRTMTAADASPEFASILLGIYANGYHLCCPERLERHISPSSIFPGHKRLADELATLAFESLGCDEIIEDGHSRYFWRLVELLS